MSDDRDIVKRLYAAVARLGVRDVSDYSVTVSGSDIMDVLSTLEFHAAEIARLRAALKDVSKYIWRGDFHQLDQSTRDTLDSLGFNERKQP